MWQKKLFMVVLFVINYLHVNARICENIHVVRSSKNLEQLRGCTIIIGYLKVILFDTDSIKETEFPELIEVTGYLLFYRVYGLTSIGKLFPNLSIIGGDRLMTDYAFVIYDLPHLKEIGLKNLRYIGRGSTRIERCGQLCFVDTIDWTSIGTKGHSLHYFNSNVGDCQWCPKHCKGLCWNQNHCQILDNQICDHECLLCGKLGKCDLCKKYVEDGSCISHCPLNKYGHLPSHSCLTQQECSSMEKRGWFIFDYQCINACPEGYEKVSKKEGWCKYCGENCETVCRGDIIDHIQNADRYHDCTHIEGNLEISVSSKGTVEELVYGLGNIRTIEGYLKVYESHGLFSLKFLKNLRKIFGRSLYEQQYSLAVFDNKNLHELWDWGSSKITLNNGTILFHYNPKLCRSEIDMLVKISELPDNFTNYDVCPFSNGEETTCTIINAYVQIIYINSTEVTITWNAYLDDTIGYVLYYREDPYQNMTTYEMEKECVDSKERDWYSIYTLDNKTHLTGLNPFTPHAFYIQVATSTSYFGGRTNIHRFKTLAGIPSAPRDIQVIETSSSSIKLTWEPPKYPGGINIQYEISVYLLDDDYLLTKQQNYCHFPYNDFPDNDNMIAVQDVSAKVCCKTQTWHEWKIHTLQDIHINHKHSVWIKLDNLTTIYEIAQLQHFRLYTIYHRVCNDLQMCSSDTVIYERTKAVDNADDIDSVIFLNKTNNSVHVKWLAPANPNSYIASYIIQYKNINREHSVAITDCVTVHEYENQQGYAIANLPFGYYALTVTAISLAGLGKTSEILYFDLPIPNKNNSTTECLILTGCILGVVSVTALYIYWRKRKNIKIVIDSSIQLHSDDVEMLGETGPEMYGVVRNGYIKSQNRACTVKFGPKHKSATELSQFLKEASAMKFSRTPHHVVSLLGLVYQLHPPLVVMELLAWGDLKAFLRRSGNSDPISEERLIRMAAEIADGLFYLSSKNLIHPDLAARNCMVTAGLTVKIVNFAINKDLYADDYHNYKENGLIPVRWMAPESITDGVINTKSNVWSYGIVLWELATSAKQPYEHLSNDQVVEFVLFQNTLKIPAECPDLLYSLMCKCWKWKSDSRTNFIYILERLVSYIRRDFTLVSFYNSTDGCEYRTSLKNKRQKVNRESDVRWKAKDQNVTLGTIDESAHEDLINLPSTSRM